MGNLTADPELRTTPKGTAVTDIRLAINRYFAGTPENNDRQEETTFVDITLWNRQAEIAWNINSNGEAGKYPKYDEFMGYRVRPVLAF